MKELYDIARHELIRSGKILIISHRKPDADTLGAAIALRIWLRKMGKDVTLACTDKPSNSFGFLPYLNEYVTDFDLKKLDVIVVVDSGASYMTNFQLKYPNIFDYGIPVINIDHHASNEHYGTVNIVDPVAASVTLMLHRIFNYWKVEIDCEMALCLLAGIYNDTGSFMHSNTSEEVYEVAADLMNRGAKIGAMNSSLFRNRPISTLRLWGRALENVHVTEKNVALSVVREEDCVKIGAKPEQLSGVIDYINMVPGVNYAVLLNEDRRGNVKGSFRTKNDDVDLSKIAEDFGGGGHPKASGFCIQGKLDEQVCYKIVSEDLSKKSLDF